MKEAKPPLSDKVSKRLVAGARRPGVDPGPGTS